MIDPTAALPLHFTFETVVLSAGGLLFAWAVLRRQWLAGVGAAGLTVIAGLHAGQFIAPEDDPVIIAVRLASLGLIAVTIVMAEQRRALIASGIGALIIGTVIGAIIGGSAHDIDIVSHLFRVAGAIAVLAWVWRETRPSVRLRVLAAFISVLAVAVVVAGGAVARVAALDARNERYARLGPQAATMLREVVESRDAVIDRAASLSSVVAVGTDAGTPSVERSRILAGEWLVVVDAKARQLTSVAADGVQIPITAAELGSDPVVERALQGDLSVYGTFVKLDALQIVAGAPIYEPGSRNTRSDVIGAILVGVADTAPELAALAADDAVEVVLADRTDTVGTEADLTDAVQRSPGGAGAASFETIDGKDDSWLAITGPIRGGGARLIVATNDDVVVNAATDLVRAFLVAILAAALLAVIAALWLSARITRPMLQLADDAERVKADFLASVSHELRTPLTPIRGYTEILRSRSVPARDASGYLDEIGLAAQRLERVVALLVDVASIEAGRFRVLVDEVAPGDVLTETVTRWRERTSRKVDMRTPRSLPPVLADAPAVSRVLDELIDNAMKFAPESSVELRARRAGDGVEISVRDDGPGIDPERLAAVREAFHQEDSGDTRRFGGLGLGLTFVEGVLEAHGSHLDISSRQGGGTTCSFVLPAAGSVGRMPPKAQVRKR